MYPYIGMCHLKRYDYVPSSCMQYLGTALSGSRSHAMPGSKSRDAYYA